jgi:Ca-activated chloride channel family protein
MSNLSIGATWPLWLLAALPAVWWLAWRSRTNLARSHIGAVTALRSLALAALIVALLQPAWTAQHAQVSVVYALDVSRSVASGFVQSTLQFIDKANREAAPALARYVVFAEDARVFASPQAVTGVGVTSTRGADPRLLYQGATNLERALDETLMALDPDRVKRVVLFTDGNQTRGDVWRAVPRLAAQGVRVFAFPARPQVQSDAWIEGMQVPAGVRRDEPTTVTLQVVSQQRTRARVAVLAGGRPLAVRDVALEPGVNPIVLPVRLRSAGSVTLTAEVRAQGDTLRDNDRLEQSAWVGPRPRVLYVESQPEATRYLRTALTAEGMDVSAVGPQQLPESAGPLEAFDAVVLSDLPAESVTPRHMQALQTYVRERGGGLLFASGENTFGEGGYSGSVLEQVLPAEFKAQEKRKDLALVLCIDRSYSMKGKPIALAKAGARAALDMLDEQHFFGVVAFDSQPHEAVPLQYVRSKRRAEELIERIQASGQTNIYPAIATAWRMLQNQKVTRKHVILLSDGDTAPADFDRLLKRMQDSKITVSTVTIGRAGDPGLMARIAELGGGKTYVAEQIEQVPQLFVEDARNVAQTSIMEEPFKPAVKRRIEAVRGLDFAKAPPLLGFISTKAKDGAEVFLATGTGAPLLARWQYGLGRTVLFTSDLKNRWAADWLQWDGYGKFWSQLTRDTLRRETGEQVAFSVVREGDEARLRLRVMSAQGAWRNDLAPRVRAMAPGGARQDVALRQTGPGHYEATVAVATAGNQPYGFELVAGPGLPGEIARRAGTRQLFYPYPDEYRSYPPDLDLLQAVAAQTGGKVGASVAEIFDPQGDHGVSRKPLWPWFAAAALVLYLLDILARRAPFVRRLFD